MSKLSYDGLKTFKEKNDETYIGKEDVLSVLDLEEETSVNDDDIIIKGQPETGDLVRIKISDFFSKVKDEIYYQSGDSISITNLNTAGFVTSSSTSIRFIVPLSKQIASGVSVSVSDVTLTLRQNNSYTHGSSSDSGVSPSSCSASKVGGGALYINATMSSTTNATNNDVIGVNVNAMTIKFS